MDTIIRTLPDIDQDVAASTGDDILLSVAKQDKVKKVAGSGHSSFTQSHTARAWTRRGDVD